MKDRFKAKVEKIGRNKSGWENVRQPRKHKKKRKKYKLQAIRDDLKMQINN